MLNFIKCFLCINWYDDVDFPLQFIKMMDFIYDLKNIEPALHSWGKPHTLILYPCYSWILLWVYISYVRSWYNLSFKEIHIPDSILSFFWLLVKAILYLRKKTFSNLTYQNKFRRRVILAFILGAKGTVITFAGLHPSALVHLKLRWASTTFHACFLVVPQNTALQEFRASHSTVP